MELSFPLTEMTQCLGGQGYDGEVDSTEQCPMGRMNIYSNWLVSGQSESESELLLVTRSNDNHSPGPVMREVSP